MITVVYGTRPEAIKLAPVIEQLHKRDVPLRIVCTGQHSDLLLAHPLLPDYNLGLIHPNQHPGEFLPRCMKILFKIWRDAFHPTRVVVQGDTATAFAAALTAFQLQIPVAHVEAGMRSYDLSAPFPEEGYRQMISRIASRHYAATNGAALNLAAEGVAADKIFITGNTGIDAAMAAAARGGNNTFPAPYVLVTLHRREAFGEPMRAVCRAIRKLAGIGDKPLLFIVPMHPNPAVRAVLQEELSGNPYVTLQEPFGYDHLIAVMRGAWCVLTDSGGIQEEAPAFGIPVLVARETTERPEGIDAGAAVLVGLDERTIVRTIRGLREDPHRYVEMAKVRHIYGDGHAAERIAADLQEIDL